MYKQDIKQFADIAVLDSLQIKSQRSLEMKQKILIFLMDKVL